MNIPTEPLNSIRRLKNKIIFDSSSLEPKFAYRDQRSHLTDEFNNIRNRKHEQFRSGSQL